MVSKPLQGSAGRPWLYTEHVLPLTPQHPVQGSQCSAVQPCCGARPSSAEVTLEGEAEVLRGHSPGPADVGVADVRPVDPG